MSVDNFYCLCNPVMHVTQGGKQNWTRAECDAFNSIHFELKLGSGICPARTGKVRKLKCACPHICCVLLASASFNRPVLFWQRHILACLMSAWVCLYVHACMNITWKPGGYACTKCQTLHWKLGTSYATKTCMATRCVIIPYLLCCSFEGTGTGILICHLASSNSWLTGCRCWRASMLSYSNCTSTKAQQSRQCFAATILLHTWMHLALLWMQIDNRQCRRGQAQPAHCSLLAALQGTSKQNLWGQNQLCSRAVRKACWMTGRTSWTNSNAVHRDSLKFGGKKLEEMARQLGTL